MDLSPIPSFLRDFLFIEPTGELSEPKDFHYFFYYENRDLIPKNAFSQKKIFVEFYQIAKEHLDLRLIDTAPFWEPVGGIHFQDIKNEDQIFGLPLNPSDLVDAHVGFDLPMYWFDNKTGRLGKSLLPCGCRMRFDNYPTLVISLYLEFFLFTNHLRSRNRDPAIYNEHYYFEPAAKLNRDIIRNFAKAVEKKLPDFTIEFSTEYDSVPPADKYGFPDNAEDFWYGRLE